jgi:preprotein translocase subunit YajC
MIDVAYAMAPQGAQGAGDASALLSGLLPMVLIFGVFYFLLIRPQQKKAKEHRQMLESVKKGDEIITQGGIYGRIVATGDNILTVEIADKVRIRVGRPYVAGLASSPPPADQNP